MSTDAYIMRFAGPNRPGIVLAITRYLFETGCDILDAQQFDDDVTDKFFGRIVFHFLSPDHDMPTFRAGFNEVMLELGMQEWALRARADRYRVLILLSRFDHCLADLLYRSRTGDLDMEIVGIVSNHPRDTYAHLHFDGIPFHHLPVTPETRPRQEARIRELFHDAGAELVVLARYMQILTNDLANEFKGRCINIHHSFLPGFKGARPYHQAHARGVKLIGATAHFVTADLDEGPIIEQRVERVSHSDTPEALARKGRDIERRVLADAVRYYIEDRVLINDGKTVVFPI